jgi:hypothetical protein
MFGYMNLQRRIFTKKFLDLFDMSDYAKDYELYCDKNERYW